MSVILNDSVNLKEGSHKLGRLFSHMAVTELKTKLANATKENQSLRSELEQMRKRLKDQEDDSSRLRTELDELEQYSLERVRWKFMEYRNRLHRQLNLQL